MSNTWLAKKNWAMSYRLFAALLLPAVLLLAGCAPRARVGAMQTETQSVELGDAGPVRVEVDFGAGELNVAGGSEKLLEAGFNYNVARLKPEVKYTDGTLVIRQPEVRGLPALQNITDYHYEWDLLLNAAVPMDLRVHMGAGTGDLRLAGLSLTGLDVDLGAGEYTIDLSSGWERDLEAAIDSGAADLTLRLPSDVGVRVWVEDGPHTTETSGLMKAENVYTNAAYGVSDVTLEVTLSTGIGWIYLEVVEPAI